VDGCPKRRNLTKEGILNSFFPNLRSFHDYDNPSKNIIKGRWPTMEACENLLELDLSNNQITSLKHLHMNGHTLLSLSASGNNMGEFPARLDKYTALEILDLSHNRIGEQLPRYPYPFGQGMKRIREINLSYNDIRG
jgi:Leucine-rich repeat (LRR) protein